MFREISTVFLKFNIFAENNSQYDSFFRTVKRSLLKTNNEGLSVYIRSKIISKNVFMQK